MSIDLSVLNEAQRAAVLHGDGPLLLLAGAGSGKTRAITYRITHLVQERHVPPWRILAVTFTNKAAGEMRERLAHLLGPQSAELHVSTFHSTGSAILRREAEAIGLAKSFVIYDDTDQLKLIKICMRQAKVQEGDVPPRAIANRFDEAKNQGKPPKNASLFFTIKVLYAITKETKYKAEPNRNGAPGKNKCFSFCEK